MDARILRGKFLIFKKRQNGSFLAFFRDFHHTVAISYALTKKRIHFGPILEGNLFSILKNGGKKLVIFLVFSS